MFFIPLVPSSINPENSYSVLFITFLAEMGDKTQISTLLFSTNKEINRWGILAAASCALTLAVFFCGCYRFQIRQVCFSKNHKTDFRDRFYRDWCLEAVDGRIGTVNLEPHYHVLFFCFVGLGAGYAPIEMRAFRSRSRSGLLKTKRRTVTSPIPVRGSIITSVFRAMLEYV